jgi:large subunit ribosomal protein L13
MQDAMNTTMNKTYVARKEDTQPTWFLVDAKDRVLGRLATRIATILRGKHKPTYTPHVDTGGYVIVINAAEIALTGTKPLTKYYNSHSGFPGGFRQRTVAEVLKKHPERVLEHAVRGMLPKTKLGRQMIKKLKVYAGPSHPHTAQQPETLSL